MRGRGIAVGSRSRLRWLLAGWLMLFGCLSQAEGKSAPGHIIAKTFGVHDGLSNVEVLCLELDDKGRLYIGTTKGLIRFDGQHFKDLSLPGGEGASGKILALLRVDDAMLALTEGGLVRFHAEGAEWLVRFQVNRTPAGLFEDDRGVVYLAYDQGVFRLDDHDLIPVLQNPHITPQAVFVDHPRIWVGAAEGAFRLDPDKTVRLSDLSVRAFLVSKKGLILGSSQGLLDATGHPIEGAPHCYVTDLSLTRRGNIVASCGDGLVYQDDEGDFESIHARQGLPAMVVRAVERDREGNLWLGCFRGGLVRWSEPEIRIWNPGNMRTQAFTGLNIHDDALYIMGYGGAYSVGSDMNVERIELPGRPRDLPYSFVDSQKRLWVSTSRATFVKSMRHRWKKVLDQPTFELIETAEEGLLRYSAGGLATMDGRIVFPRGVLDAPPAVGPDGRTYYSSYGALWRLGESASFAETPKSCSNARIVFSQGNLIYKCGSGLYRYKNKWWSHIYEAPNHEEIGTLIAYRDELWIATPKRVVRVLPSPLDINPNTGLPKISILNSRAGARFGPWLVVASAEGIVWIRTSSLERKTPAPKPRILEILQNGKPVADLNALNPEDSFLLVRFGTDLLGDPALTRYRFRLNGGRWSSPSVNDELLLPGLRAGKHRLEVDASTVASSWSKEPAVVAFRILPRWWERWDVRAFSAALLLTMLAMMWRERVRRLQERVAHLREEARVRETFGHFVTPAVAEEILNGKLSSNGSEQDVTILFADIRSFTPLSEQLGARKLVKVLNLWLEMMVTAVEEEHGMVNKFIGDAVVAVFGAPRPDERHPDHALRAALRMLHAGQALNKTLEKEYGVQIGFGVGINTGQVVAGPVGAPSRMEYTVIGEAVNIAARIESLTRRLDVNLLVSEATFSQLSEPHMLVAAGVHELKGVSIPVRVWTLDPRVGEIDSKPAVEEETSAPAEAALDDVPLIPGVFSGSRGEAAGLRH